MAQEQQDQANTNLDAEVRNILDTVGYEGFVRALFNRTGTPSVDFTHAVLGIATEVYELLSAKDAVNATEEAGDLAFYLQAMWIVLSDAYPTLVEGVERSNEFDLIVEQVGDLHKEAIMSMSKPALLNHLLTELLDVAKRWVGYGKEYPHHPAHLPVLAGIVVGLAEHLCVASGSLEDDTERTIEVNVKKLLKRYQGMKFDATLAVNRDLAGERAVLDAAVA